MASFAQLYSSFDINPDKRGKQFERFVKWFLQVDPEWSTQVDKIWLWDDYPDRWGRDCGIDIVFKHRNGETWAVQAKCYGADYEISKPDVDKFLSESNRRQIDHRLLIATTDRIGANAKQVCHAQEKPVIRFQLNQFETAAVDYPASIHELTMGKRKLPPTPHEYQREAIENVVAGFQTADRGQLIMACGTGKTLVSLWIKERLKAKRTLVLVPSLGLLSQILNDWTSAANVPVEVMCVCSDQTAGKRVDDEAISSVFDLAFPVEDDPIVIQKFLQGDGYRVVFSTYQSSPLIAEAQKKASVPSFDFIIADEAHRCAGKADRAFATVLDGNKLRGTKRLFATATPRTYSSSLKKSADEMGVEVVGMDDEAVFGKRLHVLPFGEAIKCKFLTDYRVVIVGVNDGMIADWIRDRRIVRTDTEIETDAQSLAAEIGLIKAIKDWDLQRIISFHSRVKRAESFSKELKDVFGWLDEVHKPARVLWSEHVSGEMPTISRRQKLQRLKAIGANEVGLLSNARCLSEGVDVPALDCVAFIDARSSQIDIVQAVGRVIRLSKIAKIGSIVIPVFIESHEDPERAIESSNFKPIWEVLDALKAHDDVLSNQLDQLRIELGSGTRSKVGERDLTKIVIDLPTLVDASFVEALRAHLVTKTTESWMFWYGLLQAFVKEHGHCLVGREYVATGNFRLGSWISNQRNQEHNISVDRKARLDLLGFEWDLLSARWEDGFEHLKAFWKEHGHCRVPSAHVAVDGYRLGDWVGHQRREPRTLSADHKVRLAALGFEWDLLTSQWEENFALLAEFAKQHGHCRIPKSYVTAEGIGLGIWARSQRNLLPHLSADRKARLDALGFEWDPLTSRWDENFSHLQDFVKEHGHCRVSQSYVTADGCRLGIWVVVQRREAKTIPPERKVRLDELGFHWNAITSRWEEGFKHLEAFVKEYGHCRVRRVHVAADGFHLGKWISKQRAQRESMPPERRMRLNALGFVWHPQDSRNITS